MALESTRAQLPPRQHGCRSSRRRSEQGISLSPASDAVRLTLTRVAHEHALPFDPLIPNPETIEAMQEARRGQLRSFDSVDELMADLDADD